MHRLLQTQSNHSVHKSYHLYEQSYNGRRGTSCKGESRQPPLSSARPTAPSDTYALTKSALDAMETSVSTVLTFLSKEGVSRASIEELFADFADAKYVNVMERAHQYAKCVCAYRAHHQSTVSHSLLQLLARAWESLAKYLDLQYRQAHRHYHTLRRMGHIAHVTGSQVERALKHKLDLAEQCCASQKGLLLVQAWERRIQSSGTQ